jgi:hypothetical protein
MSSLHHGRRPVEETRVEQSAQGNQATQRHRLVRLRKSNPQASVAAAGDVKPEDIVATAT